MKKLGLLLAAFALTGSMATAFAANSPIRIDITTGNKVALEAVAVDGQLKAGPQNWVKPPENQKYTLTTNWIAPSNDWKDYALSFKAVDSGRISIGFCAQWAKEVENMGWILVADLRVDDAAIPNGNFAELRKNDKGVDIPVGFGLTGKAAVVAGGAEDGGNAVVVNHNNRLQYSMDVEAGKTYTLRVKAKGTDAPAQ